MEELIQKLQNEHGLSSEQSQGILNTITGYIKEKFPMVAGAIDNLFHSGSTSTTSSASETTGEKMEEFAKEKLSEFLGGNKTT